MSHTTLCHVHTVWIKPHFHVPQDMQHRGAFAYFLGATDAMAKTQGQKQCLFLCCVSWMETKLKSQQQYTYGALSKDNTGASSFHSNANNDKLRANDDRWDYFSTSQNFHYVTIFTTHVIVIGLITCKKRGSKPELKISYYLLPVWKIKSKMSKQ